ncbi:MAG TPA: hypothetical protein DEF45_16360 [Rhodopirellula sp.]|nr:hypothetical protein [Rhodopirellula sp.]
MGKVWSYNIDAKLDHLAKRAINDGVTHKEMKENKVSMKLLFKLSGSILSDSIRVPAESAKPAWDSNWLPSSYFKRSRAVSNHMRHQTDSILTSIFGRERTRWEKRTGGDNDHANTGRPHKKSVQDATRQAAEQQTNLVAKKHKRDRRLSRDVRA